MSIVSEAGASVLSVSEAAAAEEPRLDVGARGAASIARGLLDPLAELVKLEPKSIGVGMYQHDISEKLLELELNHVVRFIDMLVVLLIEVCIGDMRASTR